MRDLAHSTGTTRAAIALVLVLVPASAHAQVNVLPPELREVTVNEHLGVRVPLDATFHDHHGAVVTLGQLLDGRRPVVLQFAYFRCPMLCNMVTNALVQVLRHTEWTAGEQFQVITLSIDPTDGPAEATQKRDWALGQYRRPAAEAGWQFLTGDEAQIR
ncbi:MAG: SCO family protein, partial [Deltaproteobacteria bacterium]